MSWYQTVQLWRANIQKPEPLYSWASTDYMLLCSGAWSWPLGSGLWAALHTSVLELWWMGSAFHLSALGCFSIPGLSTMLFSHNFLKLL
jgi:hypothetical protein